MRGAAAIIVVTGPGTCGAEGNAGGVFARLAMWRGGTAVTAMFIRAGRLDELQGLAGDTGLASSAAPSGSVAMALNQVHWAGHWSGELHQLGMGWPRALNQVHWSGELHQVGMGWPMALCMWNRG